jgi:N-methylhydantoinase B
MKKHDLVVHAAVPAPAERKPADPITTEVIRHALNSAADQMKRALVRTAFSPVIYEVLDFAVAIYDTQYRLLAQAPSLPLFMGTLNSCVAEAVKATGGAETLDPGDVILYNWPYGTGSHAQDVAMVMPVFLDTALIGYTAVKGHWLDIAGKNPLATDSVDVYQEGTIYPGIRIVRRGEINDELMRFVLVNSRVSNMIEGDLNAQIVAVRTGAAGFERVVRQFGTETFWASVEKMFDHGEALVRRYFESIPDGRYVGVGIADNDGLSDGLIRFEVAVEVKGSDVTIDFSNVPDQNAGPLNAPAPSAVSASRIAISMLAGAGESPNEGHFRPMKVITRPGSMFHALPPAPVFLYGMPSLQSMEVIYQALGKAMSVAVPACSGGDILGMTYWGQREETGESWADGSPYPVGQGAWNGGDGGTMLHISESATRFSPCEVWEAKNPWIVEKLELATDSGGPGRYRGGPGIDMTFRMTEDVYITSTCERSKTPPWGLDGGGEARPNGVGVTYPDGTSQRFSKKTGFLIPKGAQFHLNTGGGGGYGHPEERELERIAKDLRDGYISPEYLRRHYPHAVHLLDR